MIRFLLLLLILHGAELLSNHTDDTEYFVTAAPETLDGEVRTSRISIQNFTSGQMDKITATPPSPPPSMEEKIQKSSFLIDSLTTPDDFQSLRGEWKKNSTSQTQPGSPGLSPNVAHAYPTKMPIILSTEHVREPSPRTSKHRKIPSPPIKTKNVKKTTGEGPGVIEGRNPEELQEEHVPKEDKGSNVSFPSTNFATDVHSDEDGEMSASKVAKTSHVDHLSGIRSRRLKPLVPGMELASEVLRAPFTNLLPNSSAQSLRTLLKEDASSISSRLHPGAGIMSNSTSEKIIQEQEAILRKGNSLLESEHPISRKNPLSNFAERVHDIFGVSHSRTHAEDISTTSQKTRYNNISKTLLFGDVDVPETGGNRLTLTEDGLKMVTANPDLLHHEQSQLKTEAQSKLTPSEQPLATIQTKLLEGLQNNTQTSRPRNGSHGQTHRETPTYEQADQVPEPKTQTEGGLFPEKGVNSASNSTERGWTQANNSTELKMAAQIQTLLPNVTHPQTPTTQHLTRAAEHGAKTPSKGNVTIVMQQSRTHSIQDISAMMPADQIVELANTQAEPVPENQTVPGTYTKSNPVGKTTPTAATEKVGDLNQGEQFTKLFRSALEMETSTVLITTTQTNPGLTSEDQLDVTGHMRRLISTTIHLGLTPGSQQGAPTIPPGLTETHRSRSRSQNSPAQTENFRRDFRTEIPSQTTTRHGSPIHAMQGTRTQLRPSTNYHSTYDLAVSNLTNGSTYTMTDMPLRPITSALYAKTQDELFTVSQSQEDTQAKSSQATWTIDYPTANITQSDKPTSKKANLGISNVSKNTTEKQPMFMPPIQWGMDTQTQPGQMARTRPDLHEQTQPNLTVNTQLDLMTQPITVPTDLADHNQTQHGDTTVESTSLTNHDFITEGKIELVKAPEHELSTNFTPKQATQNHLSIVSKSEPNLTTQTQPDVSTQSQPDLVTHDQVTKTPDLIHISNGSADISNSTEPHTSAKLGFETQTWLPRSTQTDSTTQTKPELNEETQSQPPNTHQYPDTNPDTELEQVQTTQSHVSPKSHSVTTWIWPIMKMETTETEGVQHQQSQSIENATTVFTQTETDISLVTDDGSDRHVSSSAPPVTAEHVQEPDVSGREWHVVSNRPSQPVTQGSGKSPSWTLGTTSNPKPRAPATEEHYAVPTTREGLTVRKPEQRLSSASPTTIKSLLSPRLSSNTYAPQTTSEVVSVHPGRERIFIVDEQLPVFKVQTINVTYRMNLEGAAPGPCGRPETCQTLLRQEVASFYQSVPGFDGVELSNFTWDGRLLGYRVHLSVRVGSSMSETQELVLSDPRWLFESSQDPEDSLSSEVHSISLTEKHADPCTDWFSCPDGFQCIPVRKLGARCQSPCHDLFCHNHGICIHRKGQEPECQCPIGRDFWYMGQTCDYRMTHHRLAAIACAVVFCIIICAAAAVFVLVRRFQTQILRQKVAQTQSSYRRFSRFDDVPTHFWCPSQTWLTASASLNSLDNPAFSSSEEVFPLQALGSCVCGCQDGAPSCAQSIPPPPPTRVLPRLQTSCSSVNDIMIDSGKASDVSVSSWPMEPIHWTPFPILHQLSLQSPFHARRPHSYFEGMELVNTERSWTA